MTMIGTTLAGLTIVERINRGGMADIYLATDVSGNRFCLRVMLPEYRYKWGRIMQFQWGSKVCSRLDHPNIVHYFAHGKDRGFRFAILEYVEGSNLRERILRDDPALKTKRHQLLRGMAAGLAHVHERGFIHLDFKPENILVPRDYEPKLCDFDLAAKRPSTPRKMRSLSGTLSYWAPEQIMRQPVDERADIFAFGMTAYEMLTGRKPFTGNSREEILQKYADFEQHRVPIRTRAPDVPVSVERAVFKCLEKDPTRRYPSMSLVVRDLQG